MKQIAGLGDSRTPAMIEVAPILELADPASKGPMEERKKRRTFTGRQLGKLGRPKSPEK
jgi:hypothetical protein